MSSKKKDDKSKQHDKWSKETQKGQVKVELEDLEIKKPGEVTGGLAKTTAGKTSTYMCPW